MTGRMKERRKGEGERFSNARKNSVLLFLKKKKKKK
jgi:hypothetical protein